MSLYKYPIRHDIPMPVAAPPRGGPKVGSGRPAEYPFAAMQPGDCFLAPRDRGVDSKHCDNRANIIRACAASFNRRTGNEWRWIVRVYDKDWIACWRAQ